MRNTKQKEVILSVINNSYNHLNAEGIYKECRKILPNISLGTVYRNLNTLVENSDIIRIKMDDGIDRFDAKRGGHYHFICLKCGKIIDVFNKISLNPKIGNSKILDYEIKFTGICEECLRKEV